MIFICLLSFCPVLSIFNKSVLIFCTMVGTRRVPMILYGCSITADMFFLSLQLEFHQKIRNSMNNGEEMIITGPCVCSYSPLWYGGLTSTTHTSFPVWMTPFIVPCLKEAGQQPRMRLDVKWEQQGGTRSWEGKNRRLCLSTDFMTLSPWLEATKYIPIFFNVIA